MNRTVKAILIIAFLIASYSGYGQTEHGYNLYGQFLGNSTGVGAGFDSRFKTGGILGYSAGMGFTSISWDSSDGGDVADTPGIWYSSLDVDSKGLVIPLEVNAIMGKRASKFEIGLGATTYLIKRNEWHYKTAFFPPEVEDGEMKFQNLSFRKKVFRPNIIGTINIGYRLQRKSGFFMKLGVSILIGDIKFSPIDGVIALPNVCVGYTIPHF